MDSKHDVLSIKEVQRKAMTVEACDLIPGYNDDSVVFYQKSEKQLQCLREAAKNILLFGNCDDEQQKILINAMFEKRVKEGELIIQQGDEGDNFYIIEEGEYDIHKNDGDSMKCVATIKDKGYFGELSLLYNSPRKATIIARTDGILWGLDRITFQRIVVKATVRKREAFESLLKSVTILKSLTAYELMNLADALSEVRFLKGERIVNEGERADKMYFVLKGEVSVMIKDRKSEEEKEICILKQGEYFGERSLILNTPRAASIVSISDETVCAVLEISSFERLLGPCMNTMRGKLETYESERKDMGIITSDTNGLLCKTIGDVNLTK